MRRLTSQPENDAEQVAHGTIDWLDAGNDNARNYKWNERE